MILIFDLDDTLYDELTFVRSGFRAVSEWGRTRFGDDPRRTFAQLVRTLEEEGRGLVFDRWIAGRGSVREAVRVYRHHSPGIEIWPTARRALNRLANHPLYLVTDGHKIVQSKKVEALGIASRFRHAFLTHRYGLSSAKPSVRCFDLIRRRERCEWTDLVYVGDNPVKDFVNLNPLGVCTVRVLTGQYRDVAARRGYEARHRITSLDELPELLARLHP